MILSFRHKGLERFHRTGDVRGIQAKHAAKLKLILALLDATPADTARLSTGLGLHLLQPKNAGIYAVRVSGNWRVTFRVNGEDVEIVNYLDYH